MSDTAQSGLSDNALGAIAYITVFPAIFFLAIPPYNKRSFVRFHAWQSVVLAVVLILITYGLAFTLFFGAFAYLAFRWIGWWVWTLVWLWCALGALNGKRTKLPIIGEWAEKQAER